MRNITPNDVQHNYDGTTIIFIRSPKYGDKKVMVNTEDYYNLELSKHRWYLRRGGNKHRDVFYAQTYRNKKTLSIHGLIIGIREGYIIDHINGNGLDNRKNNLRHLTSRENSRNKNYGWGEIKYKGVSAIKNKRKNPSKAFFNRFSATIVEKGKRIKIGAFQTAEEAAIAYDREAMRLDGYYSGLNFPTGPPPEIFKKIEEEKKTLLIEYEKLKKEKPIGVVFHTGPGLKRPWIFRLPTRAGSDANKTFGFYDTKEEAATERDLEMLRRNLIEDSRTDLNFPDKLEQYLEEINND